jgi:hypothetical protein
MATKRLELAPKQKNFFRFVPPVSDFEFRRDGNEILLAFTAVSSVPTDLRVRLYEVRADGERTARREAIVADAATRADAPGFAKSNRFVTVEGSKTLELLASEHGFDNPTPAVEHFHNREFKKFRPSGLEDGDFVFIPQLRQREAIALGPLLDVEDVAGALPNGAHRHQARWSVETAHYDPLDPAAWTADSVMRTGAA